MNSLSDILQTGRQALSIQQLAMQVIGQNTANVNTEGYSRRILDLATAPPFDYSEGWNAGSGVDIEFLGRVRDRIVDAQFRRSASSMSYWESKDGQLEQLEGVFSELDGNGISTQLSQFWTAWQDVANDPESQSSRMTLLMRAQSLTSGMHQEAASLDDRYRDADQQILAAAQQVNALTDEIAHLNVGIVNTETSGREASDLRDRRDQALDTLSKLIDIQYTESGNGAVNVYSGGHSLVQVDISHHLQISTNAVGGLPTTNLSYEGGRPLELSGGSLKGLLDLRDKDIATVKGELNAFATQLAARVNDIHRTGYGLHNGSGVEFFASDVTGAADFRVSQLIVDDVSRIAAAGSADAPGDNSIALRIAGIQGERLMENGQSTLDQYYTNLVLRVGSNRAYAKQQSAIEQTVNEGISNRRETLSGVSMDEEMTRLVQVQQAYDAAAKIITTVDEMMATLINMGGA